MREHSEGLMYQCPLCGRVVSKTIIEASRYDYRCLGRGTIHNCSKYLSDYIMIKGSDDVNCTDTE